MTTCIALFRGINVGGRNVLPMKELVAVLQDLGATQVRTVAQSGNAVFECAQKNLATLDHRLAAEIHRRRGFAPQVLLLDTAALDRAIKGNPFRDAEADPASLHLGFLAATPKKPDMAKLEALRKPSERFHLGARVFYLHAPEGVGRSKLAAGAEKLLGVAMTDRNWRTVCRIRDLAEQ